MTQNDEARDREAAQGGGWSATGWLLGILGGISAFLGLFILFGPEDEYVGIGGDLSWRVGDISSAWLYGLLIGGFVALAVGLAMIVVGGRRTERVGGRSSEQAELMWHVGIFVLVNAFIWIQDLAIGGGVDYAYWVTVPWAIGLWAHAVMYYRGRRPTPRMEGHSGDLQPH